MAYSSSIEVSRLRVSAAALLFAVVTMSACEAKKSTVETLPPRSSSPPTPPPPSASTDSVKEVTDTCVGPYASYWGDATNTPPPGAAHVFRLSQAFPKQLPPLAEQPWLAANPFSATTLAQRGTESSKYVHAILEYIFEGNVGSAPSETDFDICRNPVRPWFHVPWMDANASKGREYVHGMTRELAPSPKKLGPAQVNTEAAWAVGFYNARGAFVLGQLFSGSSKADVKVPSAHLHFPEGTVVGKALFTTATPDTLPYLKGAPRWQANILPAPCGGRFTGTAKAPDGTMVACTRTLHDVYLAQFDVAVVDLRAPLKWVFGTFVYDGLEDASRGWRGLRPVGLMWGNDPGLEPKGTNPDANDPATRGLTPPERVTQSFMFTDTLPPWLRKDLGCSGRLDGPIDNPRSSCMSCHASASTPLLLAATQKNPCTNAAVATATVVKAPILGDFSKQCGDVAIDKIWFRNIPQGTPIDAPEICAGQKWISLDYSLQVGEALANYLQTQTPGAQTTASTPSLAALRSPKAPKDPDTRR